MTYFAVSFSDLMNFDPSVANKMTLGEKLENILTTAVGGYLLVFVVLALIWGLLEIFNVIFAKKPKALTHKEIKEETIPEPIIQKKTDDSELVAVITSAISAYTGKEQSTFKVVSFRKKKE